MIRRERVFGPGWTVPLDRNAKARKATNARTWSTATDSRAVGAAQALRSRLSHNRFSSGTDAGRFQRQSRNRARHCLRRGHQGGHHAQRTVAQYSDLITLS
jgi:hypothetical protein